MYNYRKFYVLLGLSLLLMAAQALFAQGYNFRLRATDGSGVTDTLTLATDPAGTVNIDSVSPSLKEAELPDLAQGLDVRVVTNVGWDSLGFGSYTSIHHFSFITQTDIWMIQYKVDSGLTACDFFWPPGLGLLGSGSWTMVPDGSDPVQFPDIDMTSTTTAHIDGLDNLPHRLLIITTDGTTFRTFTPESIAFAGDFKYRTKGGKPGKAEKRKSYASQWCLQFTTLSDSIVGLHGEFGQAIYDVITPNVNASGFLSQGPFDPAKTTSADSPGKQKKFNFFTPTGVLLDSNITVEICGYGDKGKLMECKKYWWQKLISGTPTDIAKPPKNLKSAIAAVLTPGSLRLLAPMPNPNNVGEEIYLQEGPLGINPALGIAIGRMTGDGKSGVGAFHPKWKDVTKTLYDPKFGGFIHHDSVHCLDHFTDGSSKLIVKPQKSLNPSKHNNVLMAEAVTLRYNIYMSKAGKVDGDKQSFGDLIYVPQPGDPPGLAALSIESLDSVAVAMDFMLACSVNPYIASGTYAQWYNVLDRINKAFSGPIDTVSFMKPAGIKGTGGTIFTGVKRIDQVSFLHRASNATHSLALPPLDISSLERTPEQYELLQNYPNPFNPVTTIEFNLPEDAIVTMKVYNMLGQEVATLAENEEFTEGNNYVTFDASSVASGVYYYRMVVNNGQFQTVKKMLLMK